MKFTLRLYRRHDMDLIALYKHDTFGFQKALKASLRAYIKGEPYLLQMPPLKDYSDYDFRYCYRTIISLNDVYDKDIIDWLKKAKPSEKTALIKTTLRGSLVGPLSYVCIEDKDEINHTEKILLQIQEFYPNLQSFPTKRKYKNKKKKDHLLEKIPTYKKEPEITETPKDTNGIEDNTETDTDFDLYSNIESLLTNF